MCELQIHTLTTTGLLHLCNDQQYCTSAIHTNQRQSRDQVLDLIHNRMSSTRNGKPYDDSNFNTNYFEIILSLNIVLLLCCLLRSISNLVCGFESTAPLFGAEIDSYLEEVPLLCIIYSVTLMVLYSNDISKPITAGKCLGSCFLICSVLLRDWCVSPYPVERSQRLCCFYRSILLTQLVTHYSIP
jgi:hypothetical protein